MDTLHPAVVHFAVVLPLVALSFEGLYILKKEKAYSKASLVTVTFAFIFVLASFFTGRDDAQGGLMEYFMAFNEEGVHELKEHAELGINLLIALGVVSLLKIANVFKLKNSNVDKLIAASLLVVSVMMLNQGKEGGEIVYEHGAIFQAHEMKETLKESLVDLQDTEDDTERVEILETAIKASLKIAE
jgi:uncharacterized membrane protein